MGIPDINNNAVSSGPARPAGEMVEWLTGRPLSSLAPETEFLRVGDAALAADRLTGTVTFREGSSAAQDVTALLRSMFNSGVHPKELGASGMMDMARNFIRNFNSLSEKTKGSVLMLSGLMASSLNGVLSGLDSVPGMGVSPVSAAKPGSEGVLSALASALTFAGSAQSILGIMSENSTAVGMSPSPGVPDMASDGMAKRPVAEGLASERYMPLSQPVFDSPMSLARWLNPELDLSRNPARDVTLFKNQLGDLSFNQLSGTFAFTQTSGKVIPATDLVRGLKMANIHPAALSVSAFSTLLAQSGKGKSAESIASTAKTLLSAVKTGGVSLLKKIADFTGEAEREARIR